MNLTPEDLLGGSNVTFEVIVPPEVLNPVKNLNPTTKEVVVELRPLSIGAFGLIMKAAKNESGLIPLLMIQESLVKPALSLEQIKQMQMGLVNFLIAHIRQISGLTPKKN
ncbi:MAG: hypothetical protein AAGJ08_00320 [Cyanobacteria bacterium P01_H01_bin.35]